MMKKNFIDYVAMIFVFVGALNWGLVGFFKFNLVTAIFGATTLTTIVYDIVGVAAVYLLIRCLFCCKKCCDKK